MRRTAVIATAFLLLGAVWASASAQPNRDVLPVGTPLVFVVDGTLGMGAREGTVVPIHLREPLVLDGTVVAASGAKAELLLDRVGSADGKVPRLIVLRNFISVAGLIPVRPDRPIASPVEFGSTITATTQAQVVRVGSRLSIRTPFPFPLSNEPPAMTYTPTPARTANPNAPVPGRRRPRGTPAPTASPTASPAAGASAPPTDTPTPYPTPLATSSSAPR